MKKIYFVEESEIKPDGSTFNDPLTERFSSYDEAKNYYEKKVSANNDAYFNSKNEIYPVFYYMWELLVEEDDENCVREAEIIESNYSEIVEKLLETDFFTPAAWLEMKGVY